MLLYGLNVPELLTANDLTGERHLSWDPLEVRQILRAAPTLTDTAVDATSAWITVDGYAALSVARQDMTLTVHSPEPVPEDELAHPLMAFVAAAVAHWTGRCALHGGAVMVGDAAWLVLAPPGGGKSTLMSELDRSGFQVLSDDLAVVDNGMVLAGPRSCDLRVEASEALGRGRSLLRGVGRERRRVSLAPAPAEAPLAGILELQWGDSWDVARVPARDRLARLGRNDALALGPEDPRAWLELIKLPMWSVRRPPAWESLSRTVEAVASIGSA